MHISALAFHFRWSLRSGSSFSSFGRGKFACECNFFGKHTCVIPLVQEYVKEEYAVHFDTAIYTFHFQLFTTHMFWVYARMFLQEREWKSYAYAFGFESA